MPVDMAQQPARFVDGPVSVTGAPPVDGCWTWAPFETRSVPVATAEVVTPPADMLLETPPRHAWQRRSMLLHTYDPAGIRPPDLSPLEQRSTYEAVPPVLTRLRPDERRRMMTVHAPTTGGLGVVPTLCPHEVTPDRIGGLQRALAFRGYDPGRFDGELSPETMTALRRFEAAERLPRGNPVALATLERLGVP